MSIKNKSMEKKGSYNSQVVDRLIKKYGVSRRFVTMSLKGDRVSETSESIKKDYKSLEESIDKLLNGKS
ncbi:hypothetical protein [Pedobacter sp.]|uniref:hypothetical protein n=1 Tax=Pedobacter sp. TaxID=1411316 RepID=UPI00396D0270